MSIKYTLIAAMAENHVIGYKNKLPWHLSEDLKNFKNATLGKTVLMGRKTCESLPFPLPQRQNFVLSKNKTFYRQGFITITDLSELPNEEIMVIGGGHIYQMFLPKASKMILTKIEGFFEGDAYFPIFNENEWQKTVTTRHPINDKNPEYAFTVNTYIRLNNQPKN